MNNRKKYLKIVKDCTPDKASECGFPTTIKRGDGSITQLYTTWSTATRAVSINTPATSVSTSTGGELNTSTKPYEQAHIFQTADGFSVSLLYNPLCGIHRGTGSQLRGSKLRFPGSNQYYIRRIFRLLRTRFNP